MLGAIGVVYGDIGTSPLYTMKESFLGPHPLAVDRLHIFGVLSLIFWSLMLVVTIKYVFVAMRADNKGEGGSFALAVADLAQPRAQEVGAARWSLLGVLATCLFYGDAMITPAISVLSAVEGLTVAEAGLQPLVIPIAIAILVGLFLVQSRGTAKVGAMFGPVMLVYFAALAALGVANILGQPRDPAGAQPDLGVCSFFAVQSEARLPRAGLGVPRRDRRRNALCRHGPFRAQGDRLVLADARLSLPDAQLSGPGRAAARHPGSRDNPFFLMAPDWARLPLVVHRHRGDDHRQPGGDLRRLLGHPPGGPARLPAAPQDRSTRARRRAGQIYIPAVNWALLAMVIAARRSASANPAAWPRPMASRSPARC